MNDRQIKYFLSVACGNTFTATAEKFHISQPTISAQIASLEEELNVKLLVRKTKSTELTEAGKLYKFFFLETEQRFQNLTEQIRKMQTSGDNSLSLGVLSDLSYVVSPVLETFFIKYPNLNIQMNINTGAELANDQTAEQFDIIIAFDFLARKLHQHSKTLLFHSPQVMFYSKKLAPPGGEPPALHHFCNEVIYTTNDEVGASIIEQLRGLFSDQGLKMPNVDLVNNIETMLLNVITGQGVAVLAETAQSRFTHCDYIKLPFSYGVSCFEHKRGLSEAGKRFKEVLFNSFQ